MEMEFFEKEIKRKNKETGEMEKLPPRKYRIDADFVPSSIDEIIMPFIDNYCRKNNEMEWLLTQMFKTEYTNAKGEKVKCDNYPFVNLRSDFAHKFFPKIIKGKKEKALSWKEKYYAEFSKKN